MSDTVKRMHRTSLRARTLIVLADEGFYDVAFLSAHLGSARRRVQVALWAMKGCGLVTVDCRRLYTLTASGMAAATVLCE